MNPKRPLYVSIGSKEHLASLLDSYEEFVEVRRGWLPNISAQWFGMEVFLKSKIFKRQIAAVYKAEIELAERMIDDLKELYEFAPDDPNGEMHGTEKCRE